MKNLITIFVMLAFGCSKSPEEKLVGTYETERETDGSWNSLVFLENGKVETYENGEKDKEGTLDWKIVGKEVRVQTPRSTMVLKIESNGDLTVIAYISKDGKREGLPKDREHTWKKSNNLSP